METIKITEANCAELRYLMIHSNNKYVVDGQEVEKETDIKVGGKLEIYEIV